MYEMHQHRVNQMIKSAEGSAGLLHKITKPPAWRGGAPILKKEVDVTLLDRCEAKRKHGKNIGSVTKVCSLWRTSLGRMNEELKKLEEALLRPKEGKLEKVSRLYKAKTGVGWLPPESPLDLTKETRGEIVELLEKVEQSGKWPQQACTTMFFLIPKLLRVRGRLRLCRR